MTSLSLLADRTVVESLISGAINKWLLLNTVPMLIGCYEKISKTSYIPIVKCLAFTRGDQKVRGKKLTFLHRLINRAGIAAHNTATHMHLIGYYMLDASRLRALQLSSRQRYIVRTGPFYIAF